MADIFVDRDGVINRNRPDHVKRWSEFEFLSGAVEALVELPVRSHVFSKLKKKNSLSFFTGPPIEGNRSTAPITSSPRFRSAA